MKKRKFSVSNNKLEDFFTAKLFIIGNRVKNDRILSNEVISKQKIKIT